ncbi:MAG TPA: MFS transporter, partial [Syntrophales bacterium]|nr:MFS transporter [Syntrophales bacterium]
LWQLIAVAVLYAFAEGTFSNWAIIYLHESKNLPETAGALALSLFWAFLAVGRLLVSVLAVFMPSERIWRMLPLFMALVFIMLPYADSSLVGVGLFALAGLSCSAFFPLTIRLASKSFPSHVAWVSSIITGALMVGIGIGTFATGLLTERLSLEVIYTISALYPLSAFLLVIVFLRRAQGRGQ